MMEVFCFFRASDLSRNLLFLAVQVNSRVPVAPLCLAFSPGFLPAAFIPMSPAGIDYGIAGEPLVRLGDVFRP
jgi:hypothetical protein